MHVPTRVHSRRMSTDRRLAVTWHFRGGGGGRLWSSVPLGVVLCPGVCGPTHAHVTHQHQSHTPDHNPPGDIPPGHTPSPDYIPLRG